MGQTGDPDWSGNLYFVPTFEGVTDANATIKLSQIKPNEDWDDGMGDWLGTVAIDGMEQAAFGFDGEKWYVQYGTDPDGEPLEEGADASDFVVPINRGMIIYASMGGQLTISGGVMKGDSELYTDPDWSGNAYTGNFTPAILKVGDIVPNGDWDDGMGDWMGTIQIDGMEDKVYHFDGSDWTDDDGNICNDDEILPGQGLIVYTSMGASISIKGALPADK